MNYNNFVDPSIYEKKRAWMLWWRRTMWACCIIGVFMIMLTLWQLYRYGVCSYAAHGMRDEQALHDNTIKIKQGLLQKKKNLTAQHDILNMWLTNPPSPYTYLAAAFTKAPHDSMISGVTFVAGKQLSIAASSNTLAAITAYRDALAPELSFAPLHVVSVQQSTREHTKAPQFAYDCVLEAVCAK